MEFNYISEHKSLLHLNRVEKEYTGERKKHSCELKQKKQMRRNFPFQEENQYAKRQID